MTGIKSFFKFTSLLFGLPLAMVVILAAEVLLPLTIRSLAQSPQVSADRQLTNNWSAYEPDPSIGKPNRTEGGGTRGPCVENSKNYHLIAIVPSNGFGATIAEYPTFLVYLPTVKKEGNPQLVFSLKTEDDKEIYKVNPPIPSSRGVIEISLSAANLPPLEVNKDYKWSFTLICDPSEEENGERSGNRLVEGNIRRLEANLSLKKELEQASSPRDRILAYASAKIWYDAVSNLAQLRRTQPNDPVLDKDWQNILKSVQLETLASEPLLEPVAASDRPNPNLSRNQ